jgi:molybdopterin-guanine dinucleotide biosynthesis protein A
MINASAYILIGGQSQRFGSQKWKVKIDGKPVLDHLWEKCSDFGSRWVVGKDQPIELDKPFIADKLILRAPFNGLYTALHHTQSEWNLILSCDLPLLTTTVIEQLWRNKHNNSYGVIPKTRKGLEPLAGFYNRRLISLLNSALENEDYNLQTLIENENFTIVTMDSDKDAFFNMNTPDDYETVVSLKTRSS